ncbi:MAG: Gfo/Idh/MocA family protein [Pseudonocardiaceae bacterium]
MGETEPEALREIVVIGLGEVAQIHLTVLEQIPTIDVVAGVDSGGASVVTFRGRGIPVYATVRDAGADHHPDVVVVATPTPTHAAVCGHVAETFPAARLLVEKPAAANLADARRVLGEIGRRQPVEVAYHMSFSPEVSWAVEVARARADSLGAPVAIEASFSDPYMDEWESARLRFCDSWIDSGINALSVVNRFAEPVERTSLRQLGEDPESVFEARLTCWKDGAAVEALLVTSWHVTDAAKTTRIRYASGAELVMDHTAVAGYLVQNGAIGAVFGSDRGIPRRERHYRALYQWWLVEGKPIISTEISLRLHDLLLRPCGDV